MAYNLTDEHKDVLRWMVREKRGGNLNGEFNVNWQLGGHILDYRGGDQPEITPGALDMLAAAGLIHATPRTRTKSSTKGTKRNPRQEYTEVETSRYVVLTAEAYEAVDSDFDAPDDSFARYVSPRADLSHVDEVLKRRCMVVLGAGGADPVVWDMAVRAAGVVLEERLRDVGGITDNGRVGRDLVNDVFAKNGTLAGKFALGPEREGYRDLYAGVVGAFRNRYAHRFVDPSPEDGGAFVMFVNLLLKMLEDLRQQSEN